MAKDNSARKRKVFALDPAVARALEDLARDLDVSLDALADAAFRDLLKKHRRPASLHEALKESARSLPANDPRPSVRKRTSS